MDAMTLSQLRTFVALAETGSVRAAAELLVVTPSAVSSALSALQGELGLTLLAPHGRGVRLTEAGEVYARYARRILGLVETAARAAGGAADPRRGTLRLAAITTAGEQVVPRLLGSFTTAHPDVDLQLEVANREHVRSLLDAHEVDLAIAGRPTSGSDLAVHGIRPNALVVVAASGPPPGEDPVAWMDGQLWLLREEGSGTRATTLALLDRLDLAPRTLTMGSNVAIVEGVAAGLGVTLVSDDAVSRRIEEGALVTVEAPGLPLRRDWHLLAPAGAVQGTARLFIDLVVAAGEFGPPADSPAQGDDQAAIAG
jgi:DNA-binding transcriptional LysR family regulator